MVLLSNNSFSGALPTNLGELRTLLADRNHFVGTLPSRAPNLTNVVLTSNRLTGSLPMLPETLQQLLLRGNEISGTVPSALMRQSSLRYLDLTANRLTGFLPVTWGRNLSKVEMGSNRLAGTVPSQLLGVERLELYDNDLSCALKGTPFRGGQLDVLTGNAFGCLWPDSAVVQADEWGEEHICEWWRMLNLSGSLVVIVSPLTVAVLCMGLFAGAYALVSRESSPRQIQGVELPQLSGPDSPSPASDDEARAYVAFQRTSAPSLRAAAAVCLVMPAHLWAFPPTCRGARIVTASRLESAVPVLLSVGAVGFVAAFSFWLSRQRRSAVLGTRIYVREGEDEQSCPSRPLSNGKTLVAVQGPRLAWEAHCLAIPAEPKLVLWTQKPPRTARTLALAVVLIVAGAGPNVLYVVVNIARVRSWVRHLATAVLALVKTACNAVLIPTVSLAVARGFRTMSLKTLQRRAQTLGVLFLLVNTFLWPLLAVMFVSPVCFRDVLVRPELQSSNVTYAANCYADCAQPDRYDDKGRPLYFRDGCPDAGGFSRCAYVYNATANVTYQPKWRWDPTCPDIFVDDYGPVFMLGVLQHRSRNELAMVALVALETPPLPLAARSEDLG